MKKVLIIFFSVFIIVGCDFNNEEHISAGFIPLGEWSDGFGGSYTITKTELSFDDGWDFVQFEGTIVVSDDFSHNSGVLLVKVTASGTGITTGNYIGVYYRDFTQSHILLANAIDENFVVIEATTLDNAKKTFTVDNVSTHVTHWGSGYTR